MGLSHVCLPDNLSILMRLSADALPRACPSAGGPALQARAAPGTTAAAAAAVALEAWAAHPYPSHLCRQPLSWRATARREPQGS